MSLALAIMILAVLVFGSGDRVPSTSAAGPLGKIAFARNNSSIWVMNPDGSGQVMIHSGGEDPDWSPDGTKIAFAQGQDIYVMNADGSGVTPCITSGFQEQTPAWSPDGTKIAFAREVGGNFDIYVVDAGCTTVTPLTTDPSRDVTPGWSPDGAKIAFQSNRSSAVDVWTMNADGTGQTVLPNTTNGGMPEYSPDGSKIVFQRGPGFVDVWVINSDGTGAQQLTTDPSEDSQANWSPDGNQLAFNAHRSGNSEVWVMNVDGTSQTNLTNNPAYDDDPDWSCADSDGDTILDCSDVCPQSYGLPPDGCPIPSQPLSVGGIAGLLSGDQAAAQSAPSGDSARPLLAAVLGAVGAFALVVPALYLRRRISRN